VAKNNADNTGFPVNVSAGGTGVSSVAAYNVLVAGTTSTSPLQVVPNGASGMVLTSQGAGNPPYFAAVPGKITLLKTLTASNSSSLTFTATYLTSAFTTYLLLVNDINSGSSSAQLQMTWSTNNGGSYLATGYQGGINYFAYNFSGGITNVNSTTFAPLTHVIGTANFLLNGAIYLYFPVGAVACYRGEIRNNTSTGALYYMLGGTNSSTSTINNIKLAYSTGVITSGSFSLYGVQQ